MDQVEEYGPPPNPAKLTDTRAGDYVALYGDESWELDALAPNVMQDLIRDKVLQYRDDDIYNEVMEKEAGYKRILENIEDNWESLDVDAEAGHDRRWDDD